MVDSEGPFKSGSASTGVFVCQCGGKIDAALDTEELCRRVVNLPGVGYVAREMFPCGKGGLDRVQQAIREAGLERVLIAGCTPRLVGKLFRETASQAGLAPEFVEVVDIREQWTSPIESDPEETVDHATRLVSVALARLRRVTPVVPQTYPVHPAALVVGGNLAGMAVAIELAAPRVGRREWQAADERRASQIGPPKVILIEASGGPGSVAPPSAAETRLLAEVRKNPRIHFLTSTRLTGVSGRPGEYNIQISQGDLVSKHIVGAIVVAAGARSQPFEGTQWVDRSRVLTQVEFAIELEKFSHTSNPESPGRLVFLLSPKNEAGHDGTRVCCRAAIRQALQARRLFPEAQITLLYHDLDVGEKGGDGHRELLQAASQGIELVRYRSSGGPAARDTRDPTTQIGEKAIDVLDYQTGELRQIGYDRLILVMPLTPEPAAAQLAALLHLPRDAHGFIIDPRVRLRPGKYVDDGIFLLGGAHQPLEEEDALLQAYMTASRVERFLSPGEIQITSPVAAVLEERCTGCGDCAQVCPTGAITLKPRLTPRRELLSLSQVEPTRCTACGACVVACPVKAITLPGWEDEAIIAQIEAALIGSRAQQVAPLHVSPERLPHVLVLGCEWSGYAAAELAGVRQIQPLCAGKISVIRMNCSARFDPFHVLWALLNGADGVLMVACPPGECHYGNGNLLAQERIAALQEQMAEHGIDPERVRLAFIKGDEAGKIRRIVAEFMNSFQWTVVSG